MPIDFTLSLYGSVLQIVTICSSGICSVSTEHLIKTKKEEKLSTCFPESTLRTYSVVNETGSWSYLPSWPVSYPSSWASTSGLHCSLAWQPPLVGSCLPPTLPIGPAPAAQFPPGLLDPAHGSCFLEHPPAFLAKPSHLPENRSDFTFSKTSPDHMDSPSPCDWFNCTFQLHIKYSVNWGCKWIESLAIFLVEMKRKVWLDQRPGSKHF